MKGASKGERFGVGDIEGVGAGWEFDLPLLADVAERFKEGGSSEKDACLGVFGGNRHEAFAGKGRKAVVVSFEGWELENAEDGGRIGVDDGGLVASSREVDLPCVGCFAAFGIGFGFDAELGFCVIGEQLKFGKKIAFLEAVVFRLDGALARLVFKEGFVEVAVKELERAVDQQVAGGGLCGGLCGAGKETRGVEK